MLDVAVFPFLFLGVNFGTAESWRAKSVDAYVFVRHIYPFVYFCLQYF